jgi:DNA-binding response OmpR family regulator
MDFCGSILIADDEETFRLSTCRLMRREGFDCLGAGDAEEAVGLLRRRRFDLLVADIRMPHNNGLRLVHQSRELDPHMAVVLVTGYPSIDTAIDSVELSVVAYLRKPLDYEELLEHARTATRRSRRRRAMSGVVERIESVLADLRTAQSKPCSRDQDSGIPLETIRTLAASLSQLVAFSAVPGGARNMKNLCEMLDCPQKPLHRGAILKTIRVLKKTKDTFKSKALGELRAELEGLMGTSEALHGWG